MLCLLLTKSIHQERLKIASGSVIVCKWTLLFQPVCKAALWNSVMLLLMEAVVLDGSINVLQEMRPEIHVVEWSDLRVPQCVTAQLILFTALFSP